ncbi:argininosuccinate lyase, partial [bacterium]|nr:argininosuccinate lyase [bacterium]
MNIEAMLVKKVGEAGKKIHTARSRNDQVALDIRLYLKTKLTNIVDFGLVSLLDEIVKFADKNIDVIMPEFTHLQHAQPVLMSHHMLAYAEMFLRDIGRIKDCLARINHLPLGSGACVGSGIAVDREFVKRQLKFGELSQNSVDAVSDRDFVIETLSVFSIIAMHLSRLSEELILWSSSEFKFIELPDEFCTGSSMMPQKKNPDTLELIRGKTGSVYGALMSVLTMMKGLPLAYNRDMQEDKKVLFDVIDISVVCLKLIAKLLPNIKVNKERCLECASKGYSYATDIADYLVKKGCAFREAHNIVGKIVAHCVHNNFEVSDMTLKELKDYSSLFEQDIYEAIKIENCIESKDVIGGTATEQVKKQIAKWKKRL